MAYLAAGHEKNRIPFDFILAHAVFGYYRVSGLGG